MEAEFQITMSDPEAWLILLLLAVAMLLPRLLSRLIIGFNSFLSPSEVKRRIEAGESLLLLDVRSPAEFLGELGHIPGAVNMPLNAFRNTISKGEKPLSAPRNVPIVLICRSDSRAAYAARLLRKAGFVEIKVMSGGMQKWSSEEFPVDH